MNELVNDAGQQNTAADSDQQSATAVSTDGQDAVSQGEQDQTVAVPDGKIGISPAQARAIEGAEGFIPDDYFVVEEKKADQAVAVPVEPKAVDNEPPKEPQDPAPGLDPDKSDAENEADFHGIRYQIVEGKPQVLMKVEGTEQFIDLKKVMDGFNFNHRNQRVAQELAQERKELEKMRDTMMLIDQFGKKEPQSGEDYDDLFNVEPPQKPAPVEPPAPAKPQEPDPNASAKMEADLRDLSDAYIEAKAYCEQAGIFFPPESADGSNPTLVGAVQSAAENEGIDPMTIGRSPARLIKILKSRFKKVTPQPGTPDAATTATPPKAHSVQKSTPEPSRLIKARAELKEKRELNTDIDADHDQLNADIIALQREITYLEGS